MSVKTEPDKPPTTDDSGGAAASASQWPRDDPQKFIVMRTDPMKDAWNYACQLWHMERERCLHLTWRTPTHEFFQKGEVSLWGEDHCLAIRTIVTNIVVTQIDMITKPIMDIYMQKNDIDGLCVLSFSSPHEVFSQNQIRAHGITILKHALWAIRRCFADQPDDLEIYIAEDLMGAAPKPPAQVLHTSTAGAQPVSAGASSASSIHRRSISVPERAQLKFGDVMVEYPVTHEGNVQKLPTAALKRDKPTVPPSTNQELTAVKPPTPEEANGPSAAPKLSGSKVLPEQQLAQVQAPTTKSSRTKAKGKANVPKDAQVVASSKELKLPRTTYAKQPLY